MKVEIEPDDFAKGLELGVWDEDFGYYRPLSEMIIKKTVELDVTTQADMKKGDW